MTKPSMTLAQLVSKLPDPDEQGMLTNIDKQEVDDIIIEIHNRGYDSIAGLVEVLVQQCEQDHVKPLYALHCLALRVSQMKEDHHRRAFALAVAEQLENDIPKVVQGYLVQELQMVGGQEVISTLGKLLHDEQLYEPAALALAAIGGADAAQQLRSALPRAKGKCRLTILQNLGVLRDAKSIKLLREAISDEEQEIRLMAVWALANIADAGSVELLLQVADAEDTYSRIKATHACLILAENLLARGNNNEAVSIYTHLRDTRTQPAERYVYNTVKQKLATVARDIETTEP